MSFVTYVLLTGLVMGTQQRYNMSIPATLYSQATSLWQPVGWVLRGDSIAASWLGPEG